ncbi:MAG: GTP-binding protein [Leptolyngbya sp. SIO1E4]|nr:GTP-binding protein [Leptolyngbya sp. SIO1E4]
MNRVRLLVIGIGTVFVLGMMLWLVDFVLRVQAAIALVSPLLAQVFLWGVMALALGGVGVGVYYIRQFMRPRRRRSRPALPQGKPDAASEALSGLERQVAQIQDQVAQTALRKKLQTLAANWHQRDVRIVLFGVGSVGKTSIVNALLGELVGKVDAPIGTTTVTATYPLTLTGIDQALWLTDTPGLLEASQEGKDRETQVRYLATEADLLLFVIDNDLRQSEYALARSLLDIGKRLIIVLNKADLYPESDLAAILDKVRSHFQPDLAPEDVVDVAANPHPIRLTTGEMAQMERDLWPLEKRLTEILRAEGADLLADSILLRSQRLSDTARQLIQDQRREAADPIIERYQWINAAVVAATPLPVIDLLATAAINAQMVVELGRVYQFELTLEEGKELAFALARTLTGLGIVKGVINLLALGMQTTIATAIASRGVQGVSAAYLTRIAGKSFVEYFQQSQDWGDGGIGEVVQQQFQLNRREQFIREFIADAIAHLRQETTIPLDLDFPRGDTIPKPE